EADGGDHHARDHRCEEPDDLGEEGRDDEADDAGDDDRAEDRVDRSAALQVASMVATPANDTPWMSGSFEPMKPKPMLWMRVARPPTNRLAVTICPLSAGER